MHRIVAIAAVFVISCSGAVKRQTEYPAGTEVYKIEGVFQVEIVRVRVKGHKIELKLVFENLGDKELRFTRSECYLKYATRRLAPKETFGGERDVDLRPGQEKRKTYIFEAEQKGMEAAAGEYDVVFAGFYTFEAGTASSPVKTPLSDTLSIAVKVP